MKIAVPSLALRGRLWSMSACLGAISFLYFFTGRVPLRTPVILGWSAWDALIPFYGPAIFVYYSFYALILIGLFQLRDIRNFDRTLWSLIVAAVLSATIFTLYPTALPPRMLPWTIEPGRTLFKIIYTVDARSNCFPSQHVALAWLIALAYREEQRQLFPLFACWALLASSSTVFVKQHYLVDLPAGLLVAFAAWTISRRHLEIRAPDSSAVGD